MASETAQPHRLTDMVPQVNSSLYCMLTGRAIPRLSSEFGMAITVYFLDSGSRPLRGLGRNDVEKSATISRNSKECAVERRAGGAEGEIVGQEVLRR